MAIVFAFSCAVVYGLADYCGGRATRSAPTAYVSLTGQAASLLVVTVAVVIIGTPLPSGRDAMWGGIAGVTSAVALASFYYALSHGAMTVVAPITAVTSAVIPVAVGLLQGERPALLAYAGMIVAVAAVALVSGAIGTRHIHTRPATIWLALLAGLGFAVIFIALDETSEGSGLWPLVAARVCSITLLLLFAAAKRTNLRGNSSMWRLAVVSGLLDMSANLLYLLAVRRGLLSVVVVVAALYPVSTVCLAFGLDRERVSRSQGVGMGLAAAALVLVSLAGA